MQQFKLINMQQFNIPKSNMYKSNICYFINDYVEHPLVTKVGYTDNSSLYACKLPSMIQNEYKYLLFEVNFDVWNIGHEEKIKNIKWVRMQTAKFNTPKFKLKKEHYYSVDSDNNEFTIFLENRSEESCNYQINGVDKNVKVVIKNKKGKYDHVPQMTLTSALETFSTTVILE